MYFYVQSKGGSSQHLQKVIIIIIIKESRDVMPKKESIKVICGFLKHIPKWLEQQQIEAHKNGVKPFIT